MHIFNRVFFVVLCAIFSAPAQADDFVSEVEENFPYQEVDRSFGTAKLKERRCRKGIPFRISQKRSQAGTKLDVAKLVHEKLRDVNANAFIILELDEDTYVRRIKVTPLTCDLR